MKLAHLKDLQNYKNILVLTHNDLDASGAPIILQCFRGCIEGKVTTKFFSNSEMKEGIKSNLLIEEGKIINQFDLILIIDISTDDEETIKLIDKFHRRGQAVVLIDHHKTSEGLSSKDWCVHDTTKSASLLFWELVQEDVAQFTKYFLIVDKYIEYVNDWDMWHWAKEGYNKGNLSPMFSSVLEVIGMDAFVALTIKELVNLTSLEFKLDIHESIYKTKEISDNEKYNKLVPIFVEVPGILLGEDSKVESTKILMGYSDSLNPGLVSKRAISELGADVVIMFSPDSVSYRKSDTSNFNILDMAVKMGGGGHEPACGSPRATSEGLYALYYTACQLASREIAKGPYKEVIVEVGANMLKLNDIIVRNNINYFVVDNDYSKQIDKCVVVQSVDGSDIKRIYHGAPVQKITVC